MYNGIGLTTPRGSGTNGYIQTNKFFIKPRSSSSSSTAPYDADGPAVGGVRKPNKDILEHDRKRRIELCLLSLREALADQGYTEDEIEEKVSETRNGLEEEARGKEKEKEGDRAAMPPPSKRFSDTQSHQIAARKQKQLEVFRSALGIKQGFESSDHEYQEESQQEKTHSSENEKCEDEKAQDREKGSVSQHFNKNGKQSLDKVRGGEDFKDLKQHGVENKHGDNSTNDSMEDGEIRGSVRNIKEGSKHQKGNNKDDSDSDSYSGKENARKRGEKSVKKQKRHDSDSESDRDARVKRKQLGNNLTKSRKYDSDDSKSDSPDERTSRRGVVEKHNKSSKSHKTINSRHPNRRHGSEDSETDDDKKTRSKISSELHRRKQRRQDSNYESSPSDIDDQQKTRGKLLEEHRKPSSRQRIESDTNNKKKEVINHYKHETRTAVVNVYESHGVRSEKLVKESSGIYAEKKRLHGTDDKNSEKLVKESSGIYAEKKRLHGTDDKNSDSYDGRKNTAVAKHNNYKKRVNSVSGSSSSDYSSDTNSVDNSHSDDSSDYSREKHGMKKTGGDSEKRVDISKVKQGFNSMTDKKNSKDVQTDHHIDGKIGRDHESWIDSSKIKQALGSSSRTERKKSKDVKMDQHSDDYDKRSHGYQHKAEINDSFEPRRDGDRDGRGSREDRKRKVEEAEISDLSFRESRRPITDVEPKVRESREPGGYGRSRYYGREDYPNSNRYEGKHESRGRTKDEQRYDDTKRRRRDDSPQYVPRDRHVRNHEDDSGRGRRR